MRLNLTAGYAVHVMVYSAQQGDESPIVGHAAAKALNVSKAFLLRSLVALSRSGLLWAMKGPKGGYSLGKPANGITLLDIIEAAEGPIRAITDPVTSPLDGMDNRLQAVADAATESLRKALTSVTLAELAGSGKKGR